MKQGPVTPSSPEPGNQGTKLSAGMGVLLRGANGSPKEAGTEADAQGARGRKFAWKRVIQISLIIADLALLGLVARLALKAHGHLGAMDLAFCVFALVLGAGLTCLAFGWDKLGD